MRSISRFDDLAACTDCPRLAGFLVGIRKKYPDYHGRAVAPFGDPQARLLIVGLAPGLHGANRSGRPFTGDHAGILLYQKLYQHGFSNRPESIHADDDLQLMDCRITNAVKCLPPQNKPEPGEIRSCNRYLADELQESAKLRVIVALGGIAHQAILLARRLRPGNFIFSHGARHELPDAGAGKLILIDSYHCSRYNTQTRRLTAESFDEVFIAARSELEHLEQ